MREDQAGEAGRQADCSTEPQTSRLPRLQTAGTIEGQATGGLT